MTLRVPKAELPTELSANVIQQFGAGPAPLVVTWHTPRVDLAAVVWGGPGGAWRPISCAA
jgi:hypothetical protein